MPSEAGSFERADGQNDAGVVEVWRPEDERPEIGTENLGWRVSTEADELAIDLREVFGSLPQ